MPKTKGSKNKTANEKLAEIQMNRKKHSKCIPFYDRLNYLVNEKKKSDGLSNDEIAKGISNMTDSGLAKWTNAESEPKVSSLIDLANYFDVSLDYLCGLSETKKLNGDMAIASKYTGLSEKALDNISKLQDENIYYDENLIKILNTLLSYDYDCLVELLSSISSIDNAKVKLMNRINISYSKLEDGLFISADNIIESDRMLQLNYFLSIESFKNLIEKIYHINDTSQNARKAIESLSLKIIAKKDKLSDVDSRQISLFEEQSPTI